MSETVTQYRANKQPAKAERINPGNRHRRIGFMTKVVKDGYEMGLYHPTLLGLENAFNAICDCREPFNLSKVSRVTIRTQQPEGGRP